MLTLLQQLSHLYAKYLKIIVFQILTFHLTLYFPKEHSNQTFQTTNVITLKKTCLSNHDLLDDYTHFRPVEL